MYGSLASKAEFHNVLLILGASLLPVILNGCGTTVTPQQQCSTAISQRSGEIGARAVVLSSNAHRCYNTSAKQTKQEAIDVAMANCNKAGNTDCTLAWSEDSTPERDQKLRQVEIDKKAAEQKLQADRLKAQQEQAERLKSLAKTTKINGPSIVITSGFIERKLQENKELSITMNQHWEGGTAPNPPDDSISFPVNGAASYTSSVPCTMGDRDLKDLAKIQIDSFTNIGINKKNLGGNFSVTSTLGDGSTDNITYSPNYPTLLIQFRKAGYIYDDVIIGKNYSADIRRTLQIEYKMLAISVSDGDDANRLASAITHAAELCGAGSNDEPF